MAFQSNAFQNNAFQIEGDAVCTPAFQPTAFQNNAFQVCPDTGECVPAFQLGAFLSAAFQVCEEAPRRGGGWLETPQVERARRSREKRQKEIWRDIERTIEDAYADAKGIPRKQAKAEVREALSDRSVARVEAIAASLAKANDPAAERLIEQITARLSELQAAALVYERMEQQAREMWRAQNEDAIAVLLMVS